MMESYKFKFKYNPLDISSIFLCDEKKKQYIEIPNADPEFGHISEEEYNYLRRILIRNRFRTDTATIMKAQESVTALVEGSVKEKRKLLRGQNNGTGTLLQTSPSNASGWKLGISSYSNRRSRRAIRKRGLGPES